MKTGGIKRRRCHKVSPAFWGKKLMIFWKMMVKLQPHSKSSFINRYLWVGKPGFWSCCSLQVICQNRKSAVSIMGWRNLILCWFFFKFFVPMQPVTYFNKLLIVSESSFLASTETGFILPFLYLPTSTTPSPSYAILLWSSFTDLSGPEQTALLFPSGTTCSRGGLSKRFIL